MPVFTCRGCGYEHDQPTRWTGGCPRCGVLWSAVEPRASDGDGPRGRITFGTAIKVKRKFIPTGVTGFDDVIGGGLIPGHVILVGGYPGSGKTTLLEMIANSVAESQKRVVIYASGEQSAQAVHERAVELGLVSEFVVVLGNQRSLEQVLAKVKELQAFLVIYDSAQKFASDYVGGEPGSGSQCKAIGEGIASYCQTTKTCAIVVNQVSQDGDLKSGTDLAHSCDTVLLLAPPKEDDEEAPEGASIRVLVVVKNRVGDENLKSFWKMHGKHDPNPGMLEHVPAVSKLEVIEGGKSRRKRRRDEERDED